MHFSTATILACSLATVAVALPVKRAESDIVRGTKGDLVKVDAPITVEYVLNGNTVNILRRDAVNDIVPGTEGDLVKVDAPITVEYVLNGNTVSILKRDAVKVKAPITIEYVLNNDVNILKRGDSLVTVDAPVVVENDLNRNKVKVASRDVLKVVSGATIENVGNHMYNDIKILDHVLGSRDGAVVDIPVTVEYSVDNNDVDILSGDGTHIDPREVINCPAVENGLINIGCAPINLKRGDGIVIAAPITVKYDVNHNKVAALNRLD